jgi:hypothetical protein
VNGDAAGDAVDAEGVGDLPDEAVDHFAVGFVRVAGAEMAVAAVVGAGVGEVGGALGAVGPQRAIPPRRRLIGEDRRRTRAG